MADPVTILSIVNGSLGIALKIGTVVNQLYTLSQRLKYAELTLQSLASECETMEAAWSKIKEWAQLQAQQNDTEHQFLLERLEKSLEIGDMVVAALEEDLKDFMAEPQNLSRFGKGKVVFNEGSFERHQNRVRGQMMAMSLLLQVVNL